MDDGKLLMNWVGILDGFQFGSVWQDTPVFTRRLLRSISICNDTRSLITIFAAICDYCLESFISLLCT